MKTAKQHFDEWRADYGGEGNITTWGNQRPEWQEAFERLVERVRADALAEKPAAPDADEERAKREWDIYANLGDIKSVSWEYVSPTQQKAWIAYAKTLPPRPVRSPGQVLWESLVESGAEQGQWKHLMLLHQNQIESAATALGIQPQE
jgi:hypothetical protein